MMTLRRLRGGSGPSVVEYPAFVAGYDTVAHGSAEEIRPNQGEVAVKFDSGSPYSFAGWLVGPASAFTTDEPVMVNGRDYLLSSSSAQQIKKAREVYRAFLAR
jgi:hypothetical protein